MDHLFLFSAFYYLLFKFLDVILLSLCVASHQSMTVSIFSFRFALFYGPFVLVCCSLLLVFFSIPSFQYVFSMPLFPEVNFFPVKPRWSIDNLFLFYFFLTCIFGSWIWICFFSLSWRKSKKYFHSTSPSLWGISLKLFLAFYSKHFLGFCQSEWKNKAYQFGALKLGIWRYILLANIIRYRLSIFLDSYS